MKPNSKGSSSEPEDKVVVDPAELEPRAGAGASKASSGGNLFMPGKHQLYVTASTSSDAQASDEGARQEPVLVRARGTREQLSLPLRSPAAPAPGTPASLPPRDPIEVLRAWPHSLTGGTGGTSGRDARATVLRPAIERRPPAPPERRPRVEDKVTLAHLALDLFREVEQIQASSRRASSEPDAAPCTSRSCDLRINALRGAVIEACLLVQRVVMTSPAGNADIEDRIQALLELLDH